MTPQTLYTGAQLLTVANPTAAASIIPAGNAGDSLTIAGAQANAVRYWLRFSGVFHAAGIAPNVTILGKVGATTIINVAGADLAGTSDNGLLLDTFFTVLPNGTVIRRSTLFVDGDLAEVLSQYVTDEPKTASAAISSNPLTLTIKDNTAGNAGNLLSVTDFQLTQMNG